VVRPGVLATSTCCEMKFSASNKVVFAVIAILLAILIAQESDVVLVEAGFLYWVY
jgi:hypothetical protein